MEVKVSTANLGSAAYCKSLRFNIRSGFVVDLTAAAVDQQTCFAANIANQL